MAQDLAIQDTQEMQEDLMANRYLLFSVGDEYYGLEISYITEIVEMLPITEVPNLPHYIKGIINLRGTVIPVMDSRLRFGYETKEYDSRTCIIVINKDGISLGLVVDMVQDVADIGEDQVAPPPHKGDESENFIKGVSKYRNSVQLLIDCDLLMD